MSSFTSLVGDSDLNRIFGSEQQGIGPGLEGVNALGAASAPAEAVGTGPGSNATSWGSNLGALGTVGGLALGAMGLGLAGNALGTAIDVNNFDKDLERVGAPHLSFMDALSAFANNATFGLAGRTLDQSFAGMNLSETTATAGLNTNDPEAANSANASGGMHGVGETAPAADNSAYGGNQGGPGAEASGSAGAGAGASASGTASTGGISADASASGGVGAGASASGEADTSSADGGDGGDGHDSEGGEGGDAKGGLIRGPGTGTSDSILKPVSNGEFISTEKAVKMFGLKLYETLNAAAEKGEKLQITIHRPVEHDPFTRTKPVDHDPFEEAPLEGARKARDGNWYLPHPTQEGAFLQVMPRRAS